MHFTFSQTYTYIIVLLSLLLNKDVEQCFYKQSHVTLHSIDALNFYDFSLKAVRKNLALRNR